MRLVIQPFGDVPPSVLSELAVDLRLFDVICEIGGALSIPNEAHDAGRGQYRSDVLLEVCEQRDSDKVLGIASVDLFSEPLNFVFGQAEVGGRAAVISIARLAHTHHQTFRDRTAKEAIHELGHTFGLTHCPDPTCVMHFSNSLADTDLKGRQYCEDCVAAIPMIWKPKQRLPGSC